MGAGASFIEMNFADTMAEITMTVTLDPTPTGAIWSIAFALLAADATEMNPSADALSLSDDVSVEKRTNINIEDTLALDDALTGFINFVAIEEELKLIDVGGQQVDFLTIDDFIVPGALDIQITEPTNMAKVKVIQDLSKKYYQGRMGRTFMIEGKSSDVSVLETLDAFDDEDAHTVILPYGEGITAYVKCERSAQADDRGRFTFSLTCQEMVD